MLNYSKLLSILKSHSTFIITSHVNPDADAIGSELAMAGILEQLGKKYFIINSSPTPYNLQFLDEKRYVEEYSLEKHNPIFDLADAAIFLDLNYINRTAKMQKKFENFTGVKICIDHHTNPENFADLMIIDESKSSTGEIIFDFIESEDELKFNHTLAQVLYSAIMTDTGSFRYSKTTPELHNKVSKLLSFGLEPEKIYDKIYSQYEFSRIKLLGEALHSIKLTESRKVAYMIVTQDNLKISGGIESDVDGFVNFALNSRGIEIGILFFELEDGVKISFRSRGETPVNKLAGEFGGGGHVNASGARLFNTSLKDIIDKVLKAADQILNTL